MTNLITISTPQSPSLNISTSNSLTLTNSEWGKIVGDIEDQTDLQASLNIINTTITNSVNSINEAISLLQQAINLKQNLLEFIPENVANKGIANGYASLDSTGKVPNTQLNINYPVLSVNNKTGTITLTKSDIGLTNVDNTTDLDKPVSTATQTVLNTKVNNNDLAPVATTGSYVDLLNKPTIPTNTSQLTNDSGFITSNLVTSVASKVGDILLTKSDVGLSNVNNTSDLNKPISTATQSALNLKQDSVNAVTLTDTQTLTNKTLIAPVINNPIGITKSDINLNNVVNLDTSNPVNITQSSNYRFTTDTEKATWNAKQPALEFTPENVANKSIDTNLGISDSLYPSQKAVKTYVDTRINNLTLATVATSGSYTDLINKPTNLVTLTGVETLTNKLLISPIINSPIGLVKADIGLNNVDNTSDLNKPISTATQSALELKVNIASLATVATSGSYADLNNKPTIPTNTNQLTNDSGYLINSNNLSDLSNAAAARINLGLGSLATQSGTFSGVNTGDVSIQTANGLSLSGQVLSLNLSSISTVGALSSSDWNTFNNKQDNLGFTPVNKEGDTFTGEVNIPSLKLNNVNINHLMLVYSIALG